MRTREGKDAQKGGGGAVDAVARTRRAHLETRDIVNAVTRQMGMEPDPLGAAEDGLCDIIGGHGYNKALQDLQVLEERLLFHGADVPDAPMMERIYFLHVLIDCMKDLAEAEKDRERKVSPVRSN